MAKLWDDLVKWLEDTSKVVGKEAGDLTLKGRLKVEIFEANRKLRDSFAEFGTMVFETAFVKKGERWKVNPKIKTIVKKIKTIQQNLKKKKTQYKKVGKKTKRVKKTRRR